MNIKQSISSVFGKYVDFSGRACRSEFWYWVLFVIVVSIGLTVLDRLVFSQILWSPLSTVFSLAVILPGIAVHVRRLHDIDRSGWWFLIVLVPIIGWILLLIWEVAKGTEGDNRFGADPLADGAADTAPPEA